MYHIEAMKKIVLYFLLPLMLLQSNMTLLITTSFYYNRNYIERYLCIQRNMENNNCHGQCYLAKKLKQQQEKEQESFKINFHEAISWDILETFIIRPASKTLFKLPYQLMEPNYYALDLVLKFFRPPLAF